MDDLQFVKEAEERSGIGSRRRLTRDAYEKLLGEDVEWLNMQPKTLEREHVIAIVKANSETMYEYLPKLCAMVRARDEALSDAAKENSRLWNWGAECQAKLEAIEALLQEDAVEK